MLPCDQTFEGMYRLVFQPELSCKKVMPEQSVFFCSILMLFIRHSYLSVDKNDFAHGYAKTELMLARAVARRH
jgi:hypothetical protein